MFVSCVSTVVSQEPYITRLSSLVVCNRWRGGVYVGMCAHSKKLKVSVRRGQDVPGELIQSPWKSSPRPSSYRYVVIG